MVWVFMSAAGYNYPHLVPGMTINEAKYTNVLKEKLQFLMPVHRCNIFLQDGAPCHQTKVVENFLGEKNMRLLDWSRD